MATEDEKIGIPVFRGPADNFIFWSTRIEAILADKGAVEVLDKDNITEADKKAAAKACSVILRGLGDGPLATVMQHKGHPKKMWAALHERHAASTAFSKAAVQTELARLRYGGEAMDKYIAKFEDLFARLHAMKVTMDEGMLVTMFFESFGNKKDSGYGGAISALQTKEDITWEQASARLMQEYQSQEAAGKCDGKGPGGRSERAFSATQEGAKRGKCFYCSKAGHWKRDCKKRKRDMAEKRNNAGSSSKAEGAFLARAGACGTKGHALLDSGATSHMMRCKDHMNGDTKTNVPTITTAGNQKINVVGEGSARIRFGYGMPMVELGRVLYVPKLSENLLSVSQLCDEGHDVKFTQDGCVVLQRGKVFGRGNRHGDIYIMHLHAADRAQGAQVAHAAKEVAADAVELWHRRLAHADKRAVQRMARDGLVDGMSTKVPKPMSHCSPCHAGKMTKTTMPARTKLSATPGEVIHSDVCSMNTTSMGGSNYFVIFIDEASGHVTVRTLKTKGEAEKELRRYLNWVQRHTGNRVKKIVIDGGGEYHKSAEALTSDGIDVDKSCADSPEENGRAERMNRTLCDGLRAMLNHAALPAKFWAECLMAACAARNLVVKNERLSSPEEHLTGKRASVCHLRTFGCRVWVHVPNKDRKKLDVKARPGVLLNSISWGKYRVYVEKDHEIVVSRHCKVLESEFPGRGWPCRRPLPVPENEYTWSADWDEVDLAGRDGVDAEGEAADSDNGDGAELNDDAEESDGESEPPSPDPLIPKHSKRVPRKPSRLIEECSLALEDPISYSDAMAAPDATQWAEAIQEEMMAIEANCTWVRAQLPPGREAITTRFVFKRKYGEDGAIARYRVRLVAHGYKQCFGLDFDETYAPVVDYEVALLILAHYLRLGARIDLMDFVTAFLNGEIKEEVYVSLPEPYDMQPNSNKLVKSLYGLRQSSRNWYKALVAVLEQLGFKQFASADYVFAKGRGRNKVVVMVYVDDLIVVSLDEDAVAETKARLGEKFRAKDLGPLSYFLGIKFDLLAGGTRMRLTQRAYLERILKRFDMAGAKPAATPMEQDFFAALLAGPLDEEERRHMALVPYRELVGSLLYLAQRTRPDITYAVGVLCRFVNDPAHYHWKAAKRVLRYLLATLDAGVTLGDVAKKGNDVLELEAYCDADWAGDTLGRCSTSGFVLLLNGGPVLWRSLKQRCVALSSTEAEYVALTECIRAIVRTRGVLTELGVELLATQVHEDNQTCIAWVTSGGKRTKHIDVQYHYSRSVVARGDVEITYCATEKMVADILTKPLVVQKFKPLVRRLVVMDDDHEHREVEEEC